MGIMAIYLFQMQIMYAVFANKGKAIIEKYYNQCYNVHHLLKLNKKMVSKNNVKYAM